MTMLTMMSRGSAAVALVGLVVALALSPAVAQDAAIQPPEYVEVNEDSAFVLDPFDAGRWAAERSTDVSIQAQAVPEAEGQLRQARAADRLSVGLSGAALRMGPVQCMELPLGEGGEPVSIEMGRDQMISATVSATQPLYTGGRAELGVDLAREGIDAAALGVEVARESVALGAQQAAYGVLRATQLAGVAATRVTAIAEHVSNAEAMEEAGMVPHFDVVQARTELAQAREDMISAQNGVEQAKAQLRRVLALPQDAELVVVDPTPPQMPDGQRRGLIEAAWGARPEIAAREAAARIARLNLRLAQRDLRPTVALTGEYARETEDDLGDTCESWQIGIVAEKPILDGGTKAGKVQSARARARSAELQLQRTREEIALEVVQALLSVQEARERIDTAEQGIVEARERRRMAQLRYREGLTTGIEVIDADAALAAAEASLVNAEYDLQLAVTRLRRAIGRMDLRQQEVETQ